MSEIEVLPELKQIIGAMLFVAKEPLKPQEIRRVLKQVAEKHGGVAADFAKAREADVKAAIDELISDLHDRKTGICVVEVADGFRLENDPQGGPWLRRLLNKGRVNRLSRPALETLAIIAYRQPIVRSEIEAVRGVAVDQILRNLLDAQLIRAVGRSDLPGKPWQFGTTQRFLEHFGLRNLDDLPGTDELRRMEVEQIKKKEAEGKGSSEEAEQQEELSLAEEASPEPDVTSEPELDDEDETYADGFDEDYVEEADEALEEEDEVFEEDGDEDR